MSAPLLFELLHWSYKGDIPSGIFVLKFTATQLQSCLGRMVEIPDMSKTQWYIATELDGSQDPVHVYLPPRCQLAVF